jgi:large subunit ribosomal protein L28
MAPDQPETSTSGVRPSTGRFTSTLLSTTIVIPSESTLHSKQRFVENDCHVSKRGARMSAHCQVTGRKPGFGKSVSHSHVRTNRRWDPNIQKKTYFVPSLGRRVTLTLSAKGIKTIDRDGIDAIVAKLVARGEKL